MIHPFRDGNNRTARHAGQLFLAANGITLAGSEDYLAAWVLAFTLGMSAETFAACLRSIVASLA